MRKQFPAFKCLSCYIASAAAIAIGLWSYPTLAKDPFRATNPKNIGDNTEAAFKAIFERGNYKEAKTYLQQAEVSDRTEPLTYAIRASLAYSESDREAFKKYATLTRQTAEQLADPLRGKIYTAVGLFLEGAASFESDGPLGAVTKLQKVFQYLDEAKKIAPDDPELNLLKGYLDLILAVNLPFSDPSEGIAQLKQARPQYLADRGIAIAYRDLKQYDKALEYAKLALAKTPDNPEAHYLKGQILFRQGDKQNNPSLFNEAKKDFTAALAKPDQLPKNLVKQIYLEMCQTQNKIDSKGRGCRPLRDQIKEENGRFILPPLD